MPRIIAHFDMDAFFAAIEERDNPQWRGLPIAVGASPEGGKGRGVVSTTNYVARAYGIRSALPIKKAWQASEQAVAAGKPPVIFVSGSFRHYHEVSEQIMHLLSIYIPHLQQRSVDEAYGDVSFTGSFTAAEQLCAKIQQAIYDKIKLTVSVGVGPNKLIAKIASDWQKPHGLTVVPPERVRTFLGPLTIQSIPGVGPKTTAYLARLNIKKIRDAWPYSREYLQNLMGKWGEALYDKVRGEDDSPLSEPRIAKSISEQTTLYQDSLEAVILFNRLAKVCTNVQERLISEGFSHSQTLTVMIRFHDFETHTSSYTPPKPFADIKTIQSLAFRLALPFLDSRRNPRRKPVRLLGVGLTKLLSNG